MERNLIYIIYHVTYVFIVDKLFHSGLTKQSLYLKIVYSMYKNKIDYKSLKNKMIINKTLKLK